MPKTIYTDFTNVMPDGTVLNRTPAGQYAVSDLETILYNIAHGRIRCGTKRPFPINWDDDDVPPWESRPNGPGFYNPSI